MRKYRKLFSENTAKGCKTSKDGVFQGEYIFKIPIMQTIQSGFLCRNKASIEDCLFKFPVQKKMQDKMKH